MRGWPASTLLPDAARLNAARLGNSPALIAGSRTWSWRELDSRADAVAAGLRAAGIGPGGRVALLAPTSVDAIAFLHGAGRVGAIVVPLNDRLADAELAGFLADVDVSGVAAPAELAGRASRLGPVVLPLRDLTGRAIDRAPRPYEPDPGAPAAIVATSGTTGRPKGAILTHGQLAASAAAWNDFLPTATGWLASLSPAHVGGLGIVWRAARAGVPVAIPAGADPASLLAALSDPRVSHVSVVAVQLIRLLDELGDASAPPHLRAVLLGGGPVPPELISLALARGWPVVPTYGMTESASGVTALPTAEAAARPGSAGRPLPGVELRVVRPSADGVGEIEVRGPSVFRGYYGRPAETAAVLPADGWYRTDDLGSLDAAGYLTVADRRLDLIVSGGENIYPAEVEAVLAGHPAVADAGVAGRSDPTWGAVPIAAVVMGRLAEVADEEILAFCRERLARFKVPVAVYRVTNIPRTSAGKLDRRALRELLAAEPGGRPNGFAAAAAPASSVAPRAPSAALTSPVMPAASPASSASSTPPFRYLTRPDGLRIAYRRFEGTAARSVESQARGRLDFDAILLLHATLSNGLQLTRVARLLTERAPVLLPDRRGSGASGLPQPRPVSVGEQVSDMLALLHAEGAKRVLVVGHSFGGLLALALAAAEPCPVAAVVAYEPPMLEVIDAGRAGELTGIRARVAAAHASGGGPAAAETFLRAIGSSAMLDGLPSTQRSALLSRGDSVLADLGFLDRATFDPSRIRCPVTLVTGGGSEPFYAAIADALTKAVAGSRRVDIPGARHDTPITQPTEFAEVVLAAADPEAGSRGG